MEFIANIIAIKTDVKVKKDPKVSKTLGFAKSGMGEINRSAKTAAFSPGK
jgi:hypothetical protein